MAKRPNILFLMSDEHRADVAGFAGNDVVRTPVLDELAATGVVFRNAYTASPICVPGRQCLMAGQMPRTCGVESFSQDLPPGHMTWARRLSQYAYKTVCCGKLHHHGVDQMQGWTFRLSPDAAMIPQFIEGKVDEEFKRYAPPPGVGKWSQAKEVLRAGAGFGPYQTFDKFATDAALDFIDRNYIDPYYDRPSPAAPVLLKLSLLQPHYPYFTDEAKLRYYLPRVEPWVDEEVFDHPFLSMHQVKTGVDGVTERDLRRATAAYYGMVESNDTSYGSVLDQLRNVGQDLDDWIIIYTSDHGEMLGEHGVWEKQKFFDGSARVPLIIRWPKRFKPAVVDENVSLCDLFATICDMAGIPLPESPQGLDSRSLMPLLEGRPDDWRNAHGSEALSAFAGGNLMIKQDALKYHYYERDNSELLFDLAADPKESASVENDPKYSDAMTRFRTRRHTLGYGPQKDPHYRNAGYQPA